MSVPCYLVGAFVFAKALLRRAVYIELVVQSHLGAALIQWLCASLKNVSAAASDGAAFIVLGAIKTCVSQKARGWV